jgi:alpha/beta superfamily hydrolase
MITFTAATFLRTAFQSWLLSASQAVSELPVSGANFGAWISHWLPSKRSRGSTSVLTNCSIQSSYFGRCIGLGAFHAGALANLGMIDVRFPKPLFQGDSDKVRTTVRSKRASKSRPNEGIVNFFHEMMNQDGVVVATCERAALMRKRPAETA